ncbi:MAG: mycofactocin system FadH/OYE family oxidoreductase 1 [Acidimicrobiales bacterium]
MVQLCDPLPLGPRTAPSAVLFGPIVTNLGTDERALSDRHCAFYARRARGGAGVVVVEGASVHPLAWPYERAPLAERCGPGWAAIASACHDHGALVLASLDHAGGQGSSAYSQRELWAPSRVPEVNSREVPKWMEPGDINEVIEGFAAAAAWARAAGLDGVEINCGQHSLLRQFLSGLTNHRDDEYGQDRLLLARRVLGVVRAAVGADLVVGLRLCADELAPWAGITPEMAPDIANGLITGVNGVVAVDYLTVVRGSIFSVEKTRSDYHEPPNYNWELCRSLRAAVPESVKVFLQGSVVDPAAAEAALEQGVAEGVEMTRALLADPDLVHKVRNGMAERVRPCLRCNQSCQVRDARNPLITCVVEPSTGHELDDPCWEEPAPRPLRMAVVGGGPAGMEAARVAAARGHQVTVFEAGDRLGGLPAVCGPAGPLVAWQERELDRLAVDVRLNTTWDGNQGFDVVIGAVGARAGERPFEADPDATVIDVASLRLGRVALPPEGSVVLFDPIGGPIAVELATELGERAVLVTQDNIAGNELSRSGDLAPANVRLQQRQVRIVRRALLRSVHADHVMVEDRYSGQQSRIEAVVTVDCGFRQPEPAPAGVDIAAGDLVAPRTVLEAVLDARRAVLAAEALTAAGPPSRPVAEPGAAR